MATTLVAEPTQRLLSPTLDESARPSLPRLVWRDYVRPGFGFVLKLGAIVLLIPIVVVIALLPLSSLLLLLPAFIPAESVLSDVVRRRGFPLGFLRRLVALALGLFSLAAIGVFAVLVSGILAGDRFWVRALLVPLLAYAADLAILLAISRVPLAYNVRNLLVRWRLTLSTALAFTVIVALLTAMLAFVNGMYELTAESGVPGNVMVLSDGSTDEIFSNLGYSDVSNIERVRTTLDKDDRPLPAPVRVKQVELNGKEVYLCSKETYLIVNQPVPNSDPEQPRRRFVQMRGLDDPAIAGLVHNVELYPGGRWFSASGIAADGRRLECVLGEGVAVTFGGDYGKPILEPGDTFELGDREWLVVGVLKSEGSTFGSEIWAKQALVGPMFRKETYTTLVLRADPPTPEAAAALAYDLRYRYTPVKVRAVTERDYFNDLSRTNQQFLVAIMVVAIIMAIGGVFGVMNTMFAAISQRIKDIAMLRLLGFKRWQVLVSFLLESLAIALVGGLLGVAVGSLTHGATAQSIISSGQGGGKTVILRLIVDTPTVLAGILFTLAMGRLGGLVPAVSAMRQTPLESLR